MTLASAKVGSRLNMARALANLSLAKLAERSGIESRQTVYAIETGKQIASLEQVERLAVVLKVSPAWLAFGIGNNE